VRRRGRTGATAVARRQHGGHVVLAVNPKVLRALAEIPECVEMNVHIHVPEDFLNIRAFFEVCEIEYWPHEPVDVSSPMAVQRSSLATATRSWLEIQSP
jgi:hypothetical protein